jgi:hypothetical protein
VSAWDLENCGVDSPQYFQGAGSDGFDTFAIGIGMTLREAIEDALGVLAQDGVDVDAVENAVLASVDSLDEETVRDAVSEHYPPLPEATFDVVFTSYCGMSISMALDASAEVAACVLRDVLQRRIQDGHEVVPLKGADAPVTAEAIEARANDDDGPESVVWEVCEPEDAALVPDTAGFLTLRIHRPDLAAYDAECERIDAEADLHHFVVLRVDVEGGAS